MKRRTAAPFRAVLLTAALLLVLGAFAPSAWAAPPGSEIPPHPKLLKFEPLDYQPPKAAPHRHVLSNGAVAYLVEDHTFPLVNIGITIRTGQYLDPPGHKGLAAMAGNLLRSGGTASMSARDFDEQADFLAASINSAIADTQGTASLNCLARNLDPSLKLFFDMLRRPAFDPQRLGIYKTRVLQSLARRNDQTAEIENREFQRLLRGDNHFSTAHETKASIEAISRDDLIAFHRKYYHPANFLFAVSGDFDTKEMLAKLEQAMGGWGS
ncbi:MAG TPA: pitrilysin family protein, partial [Bryobacterales bacterium]|nr:pitrilysin family protein [Bryobacterales bacterium]